VLQVSYEDVTSLRQEINIIVIENLKPNHKASLGWYIFVRFKHWLVNLDVMSIIIVMLLTVKVAVTPTVL